MDSMENGSSALHRNALVYALFIATMAGVLLFIWDYSHNQLASVLQYGVPWIVVFVLCYALLVIAFRMEKKSQLQELYEQVPELEDVSNQTINIQTLSKQIRNLTEDKTQEIDTLRERENYRREFLGNVSHELKTPIFSIQGYLLTLIEGGINDETIRDKYLNRINKSTERLIYIVKDLDLIAELESGNLKLNVESFNILALAQEVIDLLEIKASNNNVEIGIDKDYDKNLYVKGDIERIEQVLTNLMANAINHAKEEGARARFNFQVLADRVRISVRDNGPGISPEHRERIFERFYRVDQSRSRKHGGSGLGLSIVKHILEAHGQKIQVESQLGEGSEFYFFLEKA